MLMGTGKYSTEQSAVMDIISYINCIFQHEILDGKRMITKIVEIIPLINATNDFEISADMEKEKLEKMLIVQQLKSNINNMYRLNYIMECDETGKLNFVNYPSINMVKKAYKAQNAFNYMRQLISLIQEETKKKIPEGIKRML